MKSTEYPLIINAPSFTWNSGGIIVLHTLAEHLHNAGYNVFIHPRSKDYTNFQKKPQASYRIISQNELKKLKNNFLALYPEIDPLNPLGAKHVARWILYTVPNPWQSSPEGIRVGFNKLFMKHSGLEDIPSFHVVDFAPILNLLKDGKGIPQDKRVKDCFTLRKGNTPPNLVVPYERAVDLEIKGSEPMNRIVDIFKKSRYFFSHDLATAWLPIAALMGCVPVILHTDKDYRMLLEAQKYGIAVGMDDITWALHTQDKVKDHLQNLHSASYNNSISMIEYIFENLKY